MGVITREMALKIVDEFREEIISIESDGILAIYLIGSLGGGYYRAGQSDIDTVIIVRDDVSISQEAMDEIAERYQKKYSIPKGFGAIMIFERELFPPYIKK